MSEGNATPGADEQYCHECGEIIKENAEICPECGVRQSNSSGGKQSGEQDAYEKQKIRELKEKANNDLTTVGLLGFFFSPAGYAVIGEWKWVLINIVTLNYVLLGFFIVPFHARGMVKEARQELEEMGESW